MPRAHGVLSNRDGSWQLTAGWASLVGGQTPVSLEGSLGLSDVRVRQIGASPTGQSLRCEALSEQDLLLVATGVSGAGAGVLPFTRPTTGRVTNRSWSTCMAFCQSPPTFTNVRRPRSARCGGEELPPSLARPADS